jgi:hypothetical protein
LFGTPLSDIKAKEMTAANMMHPTSTPDKSLYIMQKGYNDAEIAAYFGLAFTSLSSLFHLLTKAGSARRKGVLNETYSFDLLTVAL